MERSANSLLVAAWKSLLAEPAKAVALAYFWLTAIGFARLFGTGIAFGFNPIDLAAPADFLVAGLRDPLVVVAAAASGATLYWIGERGLTQRAWRRLLVPVAVLFLLVAVVGSGIYRRGVVVGTLTSIGPPPMTVTIDDEVDGRPVELTGLRLVLAMSDFVVFHRTSDETVIISRDHIKRMSFFSGNRP